MSDSRSIPLDTQNIDPTLEQYTHRPHQHAAPEAHQNIDPWLVQSPQLVQNPQQWPQPAASVPDFHPVSYNPQSGIGGELQQFPQHTQPQGYIPDWQQTGDCEHLVRVYREVLSRAVVKKEECFLRDFAGVCEWPREIFRLNCQRSPYQIVLYASEIAEAAVIDPRDGLLWEGLIDVARCGINGGIRLVPTDFMRELPKVAVRFMRVRGLHPLDNELRDSNAVSDGEYWY
ncbi:hypothetical protein F4820DRAFT_450193 [Hypoxylon rubiginosum]|uniref:Uncharacterized protein n=1 Tax=Hypoxylon rubiginosum TaxID=110542 RepID=A0ACB9YVF7_9PEZI|nr:hypothetical protein F4820DRAFT_450193 [Hypoxylon rubiginosum]